MNGSLKTIAAVTMIVGTLVLVAPAPASALGPVGTVCALGGLVSGVVGKACTVATHAGRVLRAGQKLLGGHVGGALGALDGSGPAKVARAATATVGLAAIVASVVGGARWALKSTADLIGSSTRPNLQTIWFSAFYWRMAAVSALLTLPFLFAAAIQAMMRSDLALLLRAAFGYLPLGLLAVGVAAPVTMLLLAGSDEMSTIVSSASGNAGSAFLTRASALTGLLTIGSGSLFIGFFVGLLTAAATLTLWVELMIREAAVYVIVLMLPLFFAAMVWPARRIWAIRSVELLVALILSKFAIVAVLALGGAALGHTLFPGPESFLAGATLVLLAAFSPWALLRLLPLQEVASAAVAGLRPAGGGSAPISAAQRADAAADAIGAAPAELPERYRDPSQEPPVRFPELGSGLPAYAGAEDPPAAEAEADPTAAGRATGAPGPAAADPAPHDPESAAPVDLAAGAEVGVSEVGLASGDSRTTSGPEADATGARPSRPPIDPLLQPDGGTSRTLHLKMEDLASDRPLLGPGVSPDASDRLLLGPGASPDAADPAPAAEPAEPPPDVGEPGPPTPLTFDVLGPEAGLPTPPEGERS